MGKIFDLDSPLMRFLSKVADLMWLNILTFVCSIPIITAGASFTALHYACLKLVRGEETYITKDFFKSFKLNFKQSTIIWIIILLFSGLLAFDIYYVFYSGLVQERNVIVTAGIFVTLVLFVLTLSLIFPVQSHFINPVKKTIKNSFLMSLTILPKSVLIVLMWFVPLVIWYFVEPVAILCWMFWFSAPAYGAACLYSKTFKKYEPEKEDSNDDFTWSVNSDITEEEAEDSVAETLIEESPSEDSENAEEV